MKKKVFMILLGFVFIVPTFLSGQAKGQSIQKSSELSPFKGDTGNNETVILRVRNRRNSISVKKGEVYYNPLSGVRQSTYKVYIFDLKDFQAKIGSPKKFSPKRVRVKIVERRDEIYRPSNPNVSSPVRGIKTIYFNVKILSTMSGKKEFRGRGDFSKKTVVLRVRNKRRFISVKKGKVYYNPLSGVRRSTYKVFIFDLKEFKAKIGSPKKFKTKKIKVKIVRRRLENYKPSDSRSQSPTSGINTIYFDVKILSIVSE